KDLISATVKMTVFLKNHETSSVYSITKDKNSVTSYDGIVIGGRKEFPLPSVEGAQWNEYPDANEIVSATDKLKLGNVKYEKCLKVLSLIAGGEAGTAVRYYAPDVGYIHEVYNAEDLQAEVTLLRVEDALSEDMEIKRTGSVAGPTEDNPEVSETAYLGYEEADIRSYRGGKKSAPKKAGKKAVK
ncbi:MAG: hypothetical protein WCS77_10755, partial [Elusimicrobiaceae bacterium]